MDTPLSFNDYTKIMNADTALLWIDYTNIINMLYSFIITLLPLDN
jgi:hypothetical protein